MVFVCKKPFILQNLSNFFLLQPPLAAAITVEKQLEAAGNSGNLPFLVHNLPRAWICSALNDAELTQHRPLVSLCNQ